MVNSCIVCGRIYQKHVPISFHRMPTANENLREEWIEALNLRNHLLPKFAYVCSCHFSETCYMSLNEKRLLRKGAVPRLNPVVSTGTESNPSELAVKGASLDSHMSDDSNDSTSSSTSTASEQPDEVEILEPPKPLIRETASGASIEFHMENLDTICFFCKREQCKEGQNVSQYKFPSYENQSSLVVCSKHFENLKHDVGAVQMGLQAVSGPTSNCNSDAIKINTNTSSATLQNIMNDHIYTIEDQRSVEVTSNLVSPLSPNVHTNVPIPIKTEPCSDINRVNEANKPSRKWSFARYVSELKPEDFQTPGHAKASLHLVFTTIKKKNTKIKSLHQKNKRLTEQVESLKELVEELKRENETLTSLISKKKVKSQG